MRIRVVGNEDATLGFALVGVDGRTVRDADELRLALDEALGDPSVGLLLVTRDVAGWARERIDTLKISSLTPLVVEIPGPGASGEAATSLHDLVQRAAGVRLGGARWCE